VLNSTQFEPIHINLADYHEIADDVRYLTFKQFYAVVDGNQVSELPPNLQNSIQMNFFKYMKTYIEMTKPDFTLDDATRLSFIFDEIDGDVCCIINLS